MNGVFTFSLAYSVCFRMKNTPKMSMVADAQSVGMRRVLANIDIKDDIPIEPCTGKVYININPGECSCQRLFCSGGDVPCLLVTV